MQDASGAWLSNVPDITFTDKSGTGLFPGGPSITFIGGAKEKGVLDGMAAIEYRSYTPGTVTIEATSGDLTPASVMVTVLHVPDEQPVNIIGRLPAAAHRNGEIHERVMKGFAGCIVLPAEMAGKKTAVSVYDLRGRLLSRMAPVHRGRILRRDAAGGIMIVKASVVR
ncbi:MAG: hypothetical protein JW863_17790 [Chitinispirillaceae bacterium]|nr:hypothetical protein [Chitinispirillaceae bacterium]